MTDYARPTRRQRRRRATRGAVVVPPQQVGTADLAGQQAVTITRTAPDVLDTPPQLTVRARVWERSYRRTAVLIDLAAGCLAALLGCMIRFGAEPRLAYVLLSLVIPVAWIAAVTCAHGYESRYMGVSTEEYRAIVDAALGLLAVLSVVAFALQIEIARGYVVLVLPALFVLSLIGRKSLRRWLLVQRREGRYMQRTVVLGRADSARDLIRQIHAAPVHGLSVVAACVSGLDGAWDDAPELEGVTVYGCPEDAVAAVDLFDADVVAVSSHPDLGGAVLRRLAWSLEERDVDLVVAPGILEVAGPRLSIRPVAGTPLLHVERPVMSGARRAVKVVVERAMAICIAVAALPAIELVALAVHLDSAGPILFRQKRVGARGEPFEMLKFRTMVTDAEDRLAEISDGHETNAVLFKKRNDPRVTRVGKILRRYSLDELPQLLNVLRGDMSLVGPRPPLPQEVEKYEPDAVRRLRVQPGLTGLWQVSGRSDLSWEESLRLDLWYVDNWSLVLDVQILIRTLRAVVRGAGAY